MDYNKPLKAIFEIEGVESKLEEKLAGKVLLEIHTAAAEIANNGGIELFNSEWSKIHPDWVYVDDPNDEYVRAYYRYFKRIADSISESVRLPNGVTFKLREFEPCVINFDEGWFKLYGYKDVI